MFKINVNAETSFRVTNGELWFWVRYPGSFHFVPLAFFPETETLGL